MNIKVNNSVVSNEIVLVAEFNFGQFQRLTNHEKIVYEAMMDKSVFIQKIADFFTDFRQSEIEDDDVMDHEELIVYKNIGRPSLEELFKNHSNVLKQLIHFNDYDILHLLFRYKLPENCTSYYLIQSLETIIFNEDQVVLQGVCIRVDRDK
jgi:succinate dehydrogenase flavin-adding protein (antitoxin of CptAB toxin-antitoxin module)